MLKKNGQILFFVAIFVLTLAPIVNIIKMINYGANNLSNDYILFSPIIVKALDGQFSFWEFVQASWFRAHFFPVIILISIINANFFHWNTYLEMYFGVALMLLRLVLLWDMFTYRKKGVYRYLALPVLSALVFSTTQASTYTFGLIAEPFGLLLFFGTLGIWTLIRFEGRIFGLVIMVVSGIICSWTWAAGVLVWPLFFVVLLFWKYRKIPALLVWLVFASFSAIPYIYFMSKANFHDSETHVGINLFNFKTLIELLGAALTEVKFETETSFFWKMGVFGLCILCILMFLWARKYSPTVLKQSLPFLVVILWGLLGAWQISLGRTDMAPWYTSISMNFWLGLIGLIFFLFFSFQDAYPKYLYYGFIKNELVLPCVALVAISIVYLRYDVFTPPQPFYLPSRAPSSTTCLRNYRLAPTYCEGLLFQWGVGITQQVSELAKPLEQHQLSSFSPDQTWTLQGDFVLKDVKIENPLFLDVSWWTGLNGERSIWSDYRHLDLMLPAPSAITWPVDLTDRIDSAVLETAIGINAQFPGSKEGEGVMFIIDLLSDGQEPQNIYKQMVLPDANGWQKIKINLDQYLGKKITLRFSTSGGEGEAGNWAMYRYPSIFVHQSQPAKEVAHQPENVMPSVDFQNAGEKDIVFDGGDVNLWQAVNMTQDLDGSGSWSPSPDAMFQLKAPVNVCMANYSEILFDIAQTKDVKSRFIALQFWLNTGYQVVEIPLLADDKSHTYSYPLKLLDPKPYSFLQDIRVLPNGTEGGKIQFGGVKLISSGNSTDTCANYYPAKTVTLDTIAGEITPQNHIGQTFVSECKGAIDSVDLFAATYARNNTQPVIFTLTDTDSGNVVWSQSIAAEQVKNNDWEIIPLSPIKDSYQKEYLISLESPLSKAGDAITIYQSQSDQYALGQLIVNGTPSPINDLVFRYHCSAQK